MKGILVIILVFSSVICYSQSEKNQSKTKNNKLIKVRVDSLTPTEKDNNVIHRPTEDINTPTVKYEKNVRHQGKKPLNSNDTVNPLMRVRKTPINKEYINQKDIK